MASLDGVDPHTCMYLHVSVYVYVQKSQAFPSQCESSKFKPRNAFEMMIFKRLLSGRRGLPLKFRYITVQKYHLCQKPISLFSRCRYSS